jgi:hypothetical protein
VADLRTAKQRTNNIDNHDGQLHTDDFDSFLHHTLSLLLYLLFSLLIKNKEGCPASFLVLLSLSLSQVTSVLPYRTYDAYKIEFK